MIAKMETKISGSFADTIYYHEKKDDRIAKGECKIVDSSFGKLDFNDTVDYLDYVKDLNGKTRIDGMDIPFSFKPGEKIDDDIIKKTWATFSERMGFENRPYKIYQHFDKPHPHFHVVVTNVDTDGVPNDTLRGFYKEQGIAVCREIEKEMGFVQLNEVATVRSKSLKEVNANKFAYHNAIIKAFRNNDGVVISEFSEINKQKIFNKDLTETEIKKMLGDKNSTVQNQLFQAGYLKMSNKTILINQLDSSLKLGDTSSFEKDLKKQGVYVRSIGKRGEKHYSYGITIDGKKHYFKENQLPKRFSFKSVSGLSVKGSYDIDRQKKYLKTNITKVLNVSKTYAGFKKELKDKFNIDVIESKNTGGIYGISYKSNNVDSPFLFKGSQIDRSLSYKKVMEKLTKDNTLTAFDVRNLVSSVKAVLKDKPNYTSFVEGMETKGYSIKEFRGQQCFVLKNKEDVTIPLNSISPNLHKDVINEMHKEASSNLSLDNSGVQTPSTVSLNQLFNNQDDGTDSILRRYNRRKKLDEDQNLER